jgi:hypothetical protein
LTGRGIWTFEQDGEWVNITYDWKISADKPILRTLSPILKPIFSLNHDWAMAKGLQSLKLEIARRNAVNDIARAFVPPPPGPTTSSPIPMLLGTAALLMLAAWLLSRPTRGED